MKKITMFVTMLAASVLMSALPALSSSGPFGSIGPSDYTDMEKGVETHRIPTVGGTGPYGAFGFIDSEPGAVVSKRTATHEGTGPYGAFDISGMIPSSRSLENKAGCIMVAKNCPPDR